MTDLTGLTAVVTGGNSGIGRAMAVGMARAGAAATLLDAFIARMTIVPATLALLGRSAWWLPSGVGRKRARSGAL